MTIYRIFEKDVKTGELAEEMLASKFKVVFAPVLQRILFDPLNKENIILQKSGVDGIISFKPVDYDVKARSHQYYRLKDILLETVSIVDNNKPGWLYKSNTVVYLWFNKDKTRFMDGYILDVCRIRDWIKGKENTFKKKFSFSKNDDGKFWTTENIAVPIKDFPVGTIRQINKSIFRENEQSILDRYFACSSATDDSHA